MNRATEIRAALENPAALTGSNCVATLDGFTATVEGFSSKDFKRTEVAQNATAIADQFWHARLALHHRLTDLNANSALTGECVSSIRKATQSFRFMEEYVSVLTLPAQAWVAPEPTRVFSGAFPATVMSPDFKELKFQSGDVLVSYGMAYGSAAISHVSDDGGTFSHMALIRVDDKTGVVYTIEAHPEFGVKVAPIEKYLTDGKGRAALFRFQDAAFAKVAAEKMFDIAAQADYAGHPIPYDFSMNLIDHSTLFCTEVVSYAFELASHELGRTVTVPMFNTMISMKNTYILDAFGIQSRTAFAPSDVEVDPRFELLAEWRDVARVRLMHHQQAALAMEFKWLDTLDYTYQSDLATVFESRVLWSSRHLPLFDGLVDDLIPPNLSRQALDAVVNVYLTSDMIHGQLIDRDTALEETRGTLMTQHEIISALEDLREKDLASYRAYKMWAKYDRMNQGDSASQEPPTDQWHWLLRARTEP